MSEPIRRRRRIRTDALDLSSHLPTPSPPANIKPHPDNATLINPEITVPPRAINNNHLDLIRTEIIEDNYSADFAESDYWNDSHHWSSGDQLLSDDYCHFLGRYE